MIIGIDSSNNKSLICVIFGSNENIHNTYVLLCSVFKKCDWKPPLHWKALSPRAKKQLAPEISEILSKSELKVWIFKASKPMGEEAKQYYLRRVPNKIAYSIEPLVTNAAGVLQIQADKDFEITKTRGTKEFLRQLVAQLAFRIYGSNIPVFETSNNITADVKTREANLRITAAKVESGNSKAVQMADIILGVYKLSKKKLRLREVDV